MMRKICERCSREYFDEDCLVTPMEELGRIFLDSIRDQDAGYICPECRQELGIMNLLGVGK
jgi:DNA-directed RNA polymerase subunit RPC12/RpoP